MNGTTNSVSLEFRERAAIFIFIISEKEMIEEDSSLISSPSLIKDSSPILIDFKLKLNLGLKLN